MVAKKEIAFKFVLSTIVWIYCIPKCLQPRIINYIDIKSKCRLLKNLPGKGLCTLTHCKRVYSILIHTGNGGEGRVQPERRLEGQQFTKLSRKYQHD
jgi:hypothetical protein